MIDLKTADLANIPKENLEALYIACSSFKAYKGFDIFFDHTLNLYVSSTMGLNKMRHDGGLPSISNEYVQGAIEMLQFIKDNIEEYSQAKDLSKPK